MRRSKSKVNGETSDRESPEYCRFVPKGLSNSPLRYLCRVVSPFFNVEDFPMRPIYHESVKPSDQIHLCYQAFHPLHSIIAFIPCLQSWPAGMAFKHDSLSMPSPIAFNHWIHSVPSVRIFHDQKKSLSLFGVDRSQYISICTNIHTHIDINANVNSNVYNNINTDIQSTPLLL